MKKFIVAFLFCVVSLLSAAAVTLTDSNMKPASVIMLNGDSVVEVAFGSEYKDEGCIAREGSDVLGFEDISYETSGQVDVNALGEYKITYTTKGKTEPVNAVRTVKVVDKTAPTITVPSEITAYEGTTVFNFNYSARDNLDGDVTSAVVKTDYADHSVLTVTDSSGNTARAEVKVIFVKDTTPPAIKLLGFSPCFVKRGQSFTEPGFSAVDNCDGDLTKAVSVSGNVNTSVAGTYELSYSVKDNAGNAATVKRAVTVYETVQAPAGTNPSGSVIYLTFDDGPGKYTEKLLNTLNQYGVKATFFVTNQFPKYQNLIGRAYREGHAIGVHTYSHQWSLYSSKEAYFADFNRMNEVIKAQTGRYSTIFRFPGGTSNVISKEYCKGIMSLLSAEMPKSGYVEYDWSIDCADTVYKTSSQVVKQVKNTLKPGRANIILMHDIKQHTVNAIPDIIQYAMANGYTFATINPDTPPVQLKVAN